MGRTPLYRWCHGGGEGIGGRCHNIQVHRGNFDVGQCVRMLWILVYRWLFRPFVQLSYSGGSSAKHES